MIVIGIIAAVVLLLVLGFSLRWGSDQDTIETLARENYSQAREIAELRAQLATTVTYYDFGSDR